MTPTKYLTLTFRATAFPLFSRVSKISPPPNFGTVVIRAESTVIIARLVASFTRLLRYVCQATRELINKAHALMVSVNFCVRSTSDIVTSVR